MTAMAQVHSHTFVQAADWTPSHTCNIKLVLITFVAKGLNQSLSWLTRFSVLEIMT